MTEWQSTQLSILFWFAVIDVVFDLIGKFI